jgi:hypothetical protein
MAVMAQSIHVSRGGGGNVKIKRSSRRVKLFYFSGIGGRGRSFIHTLVLKINHPPTHSTINNERSLISHQTMI